MKVDFVYINDVKDWNVYDCDNCSMICTKGAMEMIINSSYNNYDTLLL